MAFCISAMLAPLERCSSERAICFLVRGDCRLQGAATLALGTAVVGEFEDRRDFVDILASMVLAPRLLRGVPTALSPGYFATGAGQGHGAARPLVRSQ